MAVTVGAALLTVKAAGELVTPSQTAETESAPDPIAAIWPEPDTEASRGAVEFHVVGVQAAVEPSL